MAEDQEDESQQDAPDPNIYQPDQESDDIEIDRRIRRANERLKRMTMVGFPQINDTLGCQDTLTVEGGFDTGWAINYIDCGKQQEREGPPTPPVTPCCPTATLVCDQISATAAQCGFPAYDGSGSIYLTETATYTSGCECCQGTIGSTTCFTGVATRTHVTDPDTCVVTETENSCFTCPVSGLCVGQTVCATYSFTPAVVSSATHKSKTLHSSGGCDLSGPYDLVWTADLSDEVTADICGDAIADLPAYPETWAGPCTAQHSFSGNSCTIKRFKYKFTWGTPLVATCKVCWIIRTTLSGEDPTDEFICETVSAGSTESSVHEVLEPSSNGTREVKFPVGPCCASNGDCSITDQAKCESEGGEFQEGFCSETACDDVTCTPKTGACCNYDDNTCTITTEADCNDAGLSWAGPDTICPDDCFF